MLRLGSYSSNNEGDMNWIAKKAKEGYAVSSEPAEMELLNALLQAVYTYSFTPNTPQSEQAKIHRLLLAAAFDLFTAAEYYGSVSHTNWFYCPTSETSPLVFYAYTNICPRCALTGSFYFHQAHKPKSGNIGATTSRLLALFLRALLDKHGRKIAILKGSEPIDVIFVDETTKPATYLFAEIKSAPMVTLPLAMDTEHLTDEEDHSAITLEAHTITNTNSLYKQRISVFVPVYDSKTSTWAGETFPVGSKQNQNDKAWAYRGLASLLKNKPDFFRKYTAFWLRAFDAYSTSDKSPIFWFTNACGQPPSPKPEGWPSRSSGGGYESISDGKTSVGMDRTDDIKKATYQVLKLGAEGKPTSKDFNYLVGIVTNLHAIRHFEDYLEPIQDIIWIKDPTGTVKQASQLPPDSKLYNLFDGIIALTEVFARDQWIQSNFEF